MTFPFFLRLFFVGIVRFIGLIALILWYQNFEVSPLPAWTLDAFLFLMQFGWTFLCTCWVFRHVFPTHRMLGVLSVFFLVAQVILEIWLTKRLTGATWGTTIRGAAQWGAFFQIALHLGAMYVGYWCTRKLWLLEHAPDEVHIQGTI